MINALMSFSQMENLFREMVGFNRFMNALISMEEV
jgi:hypothetical protein